MSYYFRDADITQEDIYIFRIAVFICHSLANENRMFI
jgi:hypothetical protein